MSKKILTNLNFAELINKCEPITEAGKEMVNRYKGYCYSNPISCSLVNNFIAEANKYGFDTGLTNILESVNKYINENNISWKLASVCENIENNNSTYNYINKLAIDKIEKILEMNEADVVSYIKAGSLKGIQYVPEVRKVCKEVYKSNITETRALNWVVTNPISYVFINENGEQFFNVFGKTYKIAENKVSENAVCEDQTFVKVNNLLEGMTRDGENLFFEMQGAHGDKIRFTLNENGLDLTNFKNVNEHFDNHISFMEYANTLSKAMNINEKMNFMTVSSNIATIFEHIDNIVLLDNVKVLNTSNNTTCAIVEAKDNVNLTVFKSVNAGSSVKTYDYVVEALNDVIKVSGIDLRHMFEDRINEDCAKQDPEAEEIKEQLEANKEAQLSIRKKKIAMLAEQYKNDPVKISLLNKIAKDLSILESSK